LAKQNTIWVWGISVSIVAQYITDSLDGAVGRYRGSGLVHWGHYVDHLLDFVFLCSVIFSYTLLFPQHIMLFLILLAIFGAHYASTFLIFSFSRKFNMTASGVGMNELKIGLIIFNAVIYFYGTGFVGTMLIIVAILAFLTLVKAIYAGQKEAGKMDDLKRNHDEH
jgi:phosphatidylglycerophosphate synthase